MSSPRVLTEVKNRGVQDMLIALVDGLAGFPHAIESVFPKAQLQLCIVHMVRGSLRYVSWKERKIVARDLRSIYMAPTVEAVEVALTGGRTGTTSRRSSTTRPKSGR